jgi:hypothetical protein
MQKWENLRYLERLDVVVYKVLAGGKFHDGVALDVEVSKMQCVW